MPVRGIVGLIALVATLLLGQSLAFGASKISGQVTDTSGNPLANVCVEAQAPILGGVSNRSTETGADGRYTIADLFTYDDYRIFFYNCGSGNYAPEYYNDAADLAGAQPVSASVDGAVTTNINAQLAPGGSVSGLVTSGGTPAAGVCVEAVDGPTVISAATTAADGTYRVKNLPAGPVDVRFARCGNYGGNLVGEYWADAQTADAALAVTVAAGADSPGIDADLPVEGVISGNVTALRDGASLAGICVEAFNGSGAPAGEAGVETGFGGNYRIGGLLAGSYTIRFSDCGPGGGLYLEQYFDGKTATTADPVAVTSGGETGSVDAQLKRTATIAGRVTTELGGQPVENACVGLYDTAGALQATTATDPQGDYLIDRIVPGSYRVGFITTGLGGGSCSVVDFLTEYYDGNPTDPIDASDLASGQVQTLAPDQDLTGIDAALRRGGAITGTVTDSNDPANPLAGICAEAYDINGESLSSDETDSAGVYRIEALNTGDYRVGFTDCNTGRYLGEFHDGATTLAAATPIPVVAAQTSGPIDAALADAGTITGAVTDAEGDGLSGICVSVADAGGNPVDEVTTGFDGVYLVRSLPGGQYKVHFDECAGISNELRGEYFDDTTDPAAAQLINVVAGFGSNADATLARGGSITGTVTNASDQGLAGICVRATSGGTSVVALSGPGGKYSVDGLDGSYTLRFSDCSGAGYLTEYYDDQPTASGSTPVAAVFDQVTPGINAQLTLGGSITGTVTSTGDPPQPLRDICVEATGPSGTVTAVSAVDGTYAVRGLLSGNYSVEFADCGANVYHSATYDYDTSSPGIADPVPVVVSTATSGIHAQLEVSGSISGQVTNELAGQPLQGVCVDAYDSSGTIVSSATTGADGNYVVHQLTDGAFRLRFTPCSSGDYVEQYYNNQPDLLNATPISVTDGQDTAEKNAVLTSTDQTPPETSIVSGPSGATGSASPQFTFSSNEAGSSFLCKLDGPGTLIGDYGACASPGGQDYLGLGDGSYVFSVLATDPVGNPDPDAAPRSFTVDTAGPQVTITGPSGLTNDSSPSFALGSSETGSSFECRLSGPGLPFPVFEPCTAGDYTGLADGAYTFDARATDPVGNQGGAQTRSFTVDTTGPTTTVSGPSSTVENGSASFTISGGGGAVSYECRLQGPGRFEGYAACATQKSYSGLPDGNWTFEARAVDAAGNRDATPAPWTFTTTTPDDPDDPVDPPVDPPEDVEPPETTFTQTPKKTIKTRKKTVKATFLFISSEAGSFECSLDGSGFSPCSSPFKTKVKKGKHTFDVRAIDEAGNVDPSPAEFAFWV